MAQRCTFTVTATPVGRGTTGSTGCITAGAVGIRTLGSATAWRNLTVKPIS